MTESLEETLAGLPAHSGDPTLLAAAEADSVDDTFAADVVTQPHRGGPNLRRGDLIGRYVILSKLGAGGMGVVHGAYDPELDRKVALKMLLAEPAGGSKQTQGRARLLREAQALAKFSHPEIVAIHDVGEHQGGVWIAMEFIEGQTLGEWARASMPTWQKVLEVMLSAGRGVAAAHAAGLIHRDLKPDNIMVGVDGRVRVMDFGLTRPQAEAELSGGLTDTAARPHLGMLASELTQHGALLGTPAYMAPEQWAGETVTEAADQFSFCVTLWEMLYGERPFVGATLMDLAAAVGAGRPRTPSSKRRVPSWLRRTLERAFVRDPTKRWPSMQALLDEFVRARRRVRNRWIGVGTLAVALLVGGVEGSRRWDAAARTEVCEAEGRAIDEVWNDETRTRVHDGLLATKVVYAQTTAERVTPYLDAHARAWRSARTRLCTESTQEQTWDTGDLDRALWCLDERSMELAALVDELEHAGPPAVQKAVIAAAGLKSIDPCLDRARLRNLPEPPAADQRESIRAIRSDLARAAALELSADLDGAFAIAEPALAAAIARDWPPLVAAARHQLGRIAVARADFENGETMLIDAYFDAINAGWPEEAADIATELWSLGVDRFPRPMAQLWGRHAEANLHAAGISEDDLRYIRFTITRGGVLWLTAGRKQAIENNRVAIAKLESIVGPDHPDLAPALNVMGNALHRAGSLEQAHEALARAVAIREKALGPDHPDVGGSLGNLANVLASMERYEESKALYQRSIALLEAALGPEHPSTAAMINNYFYPLQGLGEFEAAAATLERALAIREKVLGPNHHQTSYSRMHLNEVLHAGGLSTRGRAFAEARLDASRAAGATPGQLGSWETSVARFDLELGNFAAARERVERSLAAVQAEMPGSGDEAALLDVSSEIALIDGRVDDAIDDATASLKIHEAQFADVITLSRARLRLARALVRRPGSAPTAIALANEGRRGFESARADGRAGLVEVEAWLACTSSSEAGSLAPSP